MADFIFLDSKTSLANNFSYKNQFRVVSKESHSRSIQDSEEKIYNIANKCFNS